MIWFFGRDEQELRVETRYAKDTAEYLLVICRPDGDQCERFKNVTEFRARLIEIEKRLEAERWRRTRTPLLDLNELPRRPM